VNTNTDTANTDAAGDDAINFLSMTDAELHVACVEYRRRAQRAIDASREPGCDWSARAQESNRLVSLYLQADAELNARDAIRAAAPVQLDDVPDYDPAPRWLMVLVGVGIVVAVAALLAKAGVW
jgi:hypothetical protein